MTRSKGHQAHPEGDKITVTPEERARFKAERLRRGWRQKDLAGKVGVSGGTISNLENGKHPQIFRSVYARLKWTLLREAADGLTEDAFRRITESALTIGPEDVDVVVTLIETLRARRAKL